MRVKEKTIFEVNYNDLDEAISEEFGVDYEIVAYEELGNYSAKTFHVKAEEFDDYSQKCFNQGNYHYMTGAFLNLMCFRNKIKPGEYLVKISW